MAIHVALSKHACDGYRSHSVNFYIMWSWTWQPPSKHGHLATLFDLTGEQFLLLMLHYLAVHVTVTKSHLDHVPMPGHAGDQLLLLNGTLSGCAGDWHWVTLGSLWRYLGPRVTVCRSPLDRVTDSWLCWRAELPNILCLVYRGWKSADIPYW